jgi:hypothetical protein
MRCVKFFLALWGYERARTFVRGRCDAPHCIAPGAALKLVLNACDICGFTPVSGRPVQVPLNGPNRYTGYVNVSCLGALRRARWKRFHIYLEVVDGKTTASS